MNIEFTLLLVAVLAGVGGYTLWKRKTAQRSLALVDDYRWPPGLTSKLQEHIPDISPSDADKVSAALKQFFKAFVGSGYKPVAMPSKAADALWHEFILHTREYETFCQRSFGRFLHHTPAAVAKNPQGGQADNLRRVWRQCCAQESIDYKKPASLPLLFVLDGLLNIPDGFAYSLNCEVLRAQGTAGVYCVNDFHGSSCGGHGDSKDNDSNDSSGDTSGCSGGCGGD